MVTRTSQGSTPDLRGTPQLGGNGLGGVGAKSQQGAFTTQVASPPATVAGRIYEGQGTQLVQNLLGKLGKVTADIVESKQQQAYLDGAAAVGAGVAEEELETNIFTRAWATAGHRDYTAKLAVIDYESKLLRDMSADRELTPQEYTAKIAAQRKEIMPVIESMSTVGKQKVFDQLLALERGSIKQQTSERAKWIVESKVREVSTSLNMTMDKLFLSKGDPAVQSALRDEAYIKVYDSIWTSPDLDYSTKSKLVVQAADYALQNGDFGLYHLINSMPMPDSDLSMSQSMGFDDRLKMAKAYETARKDNMFENHQQVYDEVLRVNTAIELGQDTGHTYESYKDFNDRATIDKQITPSQRDSNMNKFVKYQGEKAAAGSLIQAYLTGDVAAILGSGKQFGAVGKLVTADLLQKNFSVEQVAMIQLQTGLTNGIDVAYEEFAKLAGVGISALMTSEGQYNSQAGDLVDLVLQNIDTAATDVPKKVLQSRTLAALPDDQSQFLGQVMALKEYMGMSTENAVRQARQEHSDSLTKSAETLNMEKAGRVDMNEKIVDKTRGWNYWFKFLSSDSSKLQYQTNYTDLFTREAFQINDWNQQVQKSLLQELDALASTKYNLPPDVVEKIAVGKVLERVVATDHGGLILPKGFDIKSEYNVPDGYNAREAFAKALTSPKFYSPQGTGTKTVMEYTDGGVLFREYSPRDNAFLPAVFKSKEDITNQIESDVRYEMEGVNRLHGEGQTVKVNGGQVTFNGENSAGVSAEVAFNTRKSLAQFEAVRYKRYADGVWGDGKKKYSIGVGVNTSNDFWSKYFPDELDDNTVITQDTVDAMFADVSDSFLNLAVQRQLVLPQGSNNEAYLEFLTHHLYQSGQGSFDKDNSSFQRMNQALSRGDKATARAELQKTPSYRMAGQDRKKYYEYLLNKI